MLETSIAPADGDEQGRGHLPWPLARFLGALPLLPLEIAVNAAMRAVLHRNPGMLRRLDEHAVKRFAIDPVDCPFAFLLEPGPAAQRLRAVSSLAGRAYDARIAGPMIVLLGLLDGTYDGDALFFSRDLLIEGDTAAVLALRNAIEDADLDPARVLGVPVALAPWVSGGVLSAAQRLRQLLGAPAASGAGPEEGR